MRISLFHPQKRPGENSLSSKIILAIFFLVSFPISHAQENQCPKLKSDHADVVAFELRSLETEGTRFYSLGFENRGDRSIESMTVQVSVEAGGERKPYGEIRFDKSTPVSVDGEPKDGFHFGGSKKIYFNYLGDPSHSGAYFSEASLVAHEESLQLTGDETPGVVFNVLDPELIFVCHVSEIERGSSGSGLEGTSEDDWTEENMPKAMGLIAEDEWLPEHMAYLEPEGYFMSKLNNRDGVPHLLQITTPVRIDSTMLPITSADKLNGIERKGMVEFTFNAFRLSELGEDTIGWSEWKDFKSISELDLSSGMHLNFEVRDGDLMISDSFMQLNHEYFEAESATATTIVPDLLDDLR